MSLCAIWNNIHPESYNSVLMVLHGRFCTSVYAYDWFLLQDLLIYFSPVPKNTSNHKEYLFQDFYLLVFSWLPKYKGFSVLITVITWIFSGPVYSISNLWLIVFIVCIFPYVFTHYFFFGSYTAQHLTFPTSINMWCIHLNIFLFVTCFFILHVLSV